MLVPKLNLERRISCDFIFTFLRLRALRYITLLSFVNEMLNNVSLLELFTVHETGEGNAG